MSPQQAEALCKAAKPQARFDLYNVSTAGQVVDLVHRLGTKPAEAEPWAQLDPGTAVAMCSLHGGNTNRSQSADKTLVVDQGQHHVGWLTVRMP